MSNVSLKFSPETDDENVIRLEENLAKNSPQQKKNLSVGMIFAAAALTVVATPVAVLVWTGTTPSEVTHAVRCWDTYKGAPVEPNCL